MKKIFLIAGFTIVIVAIAKAQGVRRLLLFAGDTSNADLRQQREWLRSDSVGVVQRDIWIAVFADPRTFRRMYEHHGVDKEEFTLVLMRKDGTEQFRSEKPIPPKELFELVDKRDGQVLETGGH